MIISRTPYRISFFGGGTDYPAWYLKEGGAVLSATIDKYCYISARLLPPFFSERHRIVWSHIETVASISEILHPAVREGLRFLGFTNAEGVEIHHQGDLPARSGIGSSSTFAVGLIRALTELRGEHLSKHQLALKALELEQGILKESVGSQDQIAAAYGGVNIVKFSTDGSFQVEPVAVKRERLADLEKHLCLLYTGSSRLGGEIAASVIAGIRDKTAELRQMRRLVDQAHGILTGSGGLTAFGELLHETWQLKRSLADAVSNSDVDEIYETARENGALGGKLLGAGAKGFMLFFVPPEKQAAFQKALRRFVFVPFGFEGEGSTTIYQGANVAVSPPHDQS
ncbi:MAG: kinase [Verrucomicrobiota bacterium]|jgi:D-glycero-alpha-D-manno-heptose-7-phosphate kinase